MLVFLNVKKLGSILIKWLRQPDAIMPMTTADQRVVRKGFEVAIFSLILRIVSTRLAGPRHQVLR